MFFLLKIISDLENPLKFFFSFANKTMKKKNVENQEKINQIIKDILPFDEKNKNLENNDYTNVKFHKFGNKNDRDIEEIYENCLRGFKYEKHQSKEKNHYKIISHFNENLINLEGKTLKND